MSAEDLRTLLIALPLLIIAVASWRAVSHTRTLTIEINSRMTELITATAKIARLEGAESERHRQDTTAGEAR